MRNRNSFVVGALMALVAPVLAFAAAYLLKGNLYLINKPALPYFVAIAVNMVLMRVLAKKDIPNTIRGIIITTFVVMVVVFLTIVRPIR